MGNAPRTDLATELPRSWIEMLQSTLLQVNSFAGHLHVLGSLPPTIFPDAHVILYDLGTPEMAAIVSFDNTSLNEVNPC